MFPCQVRSLRIFLNRGNVTGNILLPTRAVVSKVGGVQGSLRHVKKIFELLFMYFVDLETKNEALLIFNIWIDTGTLTRFLGQMFTFHLWYVRSPEGRAG